MTALSTSEFSALVSVAQIGEVRLIDAEATTRIRSPKETGEKTELTISHGGHMAGELGSDGLFRVNAHVETRVADPSAKGEPYFSVGVTFEVTYRVPSGFKPTKAALARFAETNGVFNAWPYCREFIQSTTARMGIPPLVLPLFRNPERSRTKSKITPKRMQ